jgi:hypothetical protein
VLVAEFLFPISDLLKKVEIDFGGKKSELKVNLATFHYWTEARGQYGRNRMSRVNKTFISVL